MASILMGTLHSAQAQAPNVLFIAVDDLAPTLGCYGDTVAQTPQIDSLASQGVSFLNHYTQWAVCGPSRAALTTSLMPEETNVMGFRKIRDKNFLPNVTTLPQHFRNFGYETACTGKFHDNRTVGTPVAVSGTYPDGVMDDGKDVDDPASWSIPYVKAASGFSPATKVAVDDTDQADSLYEDAKILTEALDLIDDLAAPGGAAPGNKPFFLAVGFKKPHLPLVAPKAYWDLYDRAAMPLSSFTGLPAGATGYNASTLGNNSELTGGGDDTTNGYLPYTDTPALLGDLDSQRELLHGYYACVSFIDNLVGQLRTKLAATPDPNQPGKTLAETTLIVLWGDHGFHLGDHGKWAKHTAMDGATASPLIIYDPRTPKGPGNNTTTSVAGTTDIYPTLCELAALPIPEQPATTSGTTGRPLRGRSLVSVMNNPTTSVHHGVVSQFNISGQYGYAYRTERFRYIEWISASGNMDDGNARRDLFDYAVDPRETKNLATDPAYAAVVYQLSRSMRDETTVRGTGRLLGAAPMATGSTAFLPGVTLEAEGAGLLLGWPGSGGVSYQILARANLVSGTWGADFVNVAGSEQAMPKTGNSRFYRVGFGSNRPPVFLADPLVKPAATPGAAYASSLAGDVSDPGDSLVFTKLSGPSWLNVAANGALSGTPPAETDSADYFEVQVTDTSNHPARVLVQITVGDFIEPPAPAINAATVQSVSGSGTYGNVFYSNITVQAGDMLLVAHTNNKNTATNTISLGGLGGNPVQQVNSGSTGTQSGAWVFSSEILTSGTLNVTLDTSNATKTVSHTTTLFVLRPENGTLGIVATDAKSATGSPGVVTLTADFAMPGGVAAAYGVAATALNASTLSTNPSGWTQQANGVDKRRTLSNPAVSGTTHSATFTATAASDLAIAGVLVEVVP